MSKAELSNELVLELAKAKSAEEAAEILRAAGQELAEDEVQKLYQEVSNQLGELDDQRLSLDELEVVSGGGEVNTIAGIAWREVRMWMDEGCAAMVEPGSWCSGSKRDSCSLAYTCYPDEPVDDTTCKICGGYMWRQATSAGYVYKCRNGHEQSA